MTVTSSMKLGTAELLRLAADGRAAPARFLLVGASGFAVNNAVMAVAIEGLALHYLAAAAVATVAATSWNFLWTELWVFGDREGRNRRAYRLTAYAGLSALGLAARSPLLYLLTTVFGLHYLVSNTLSIAALTAIRYALSARWIWRPHTPGPGAPVDRGAAP
jgi:putative flippase GtrA